jgi:16S rRNA (guanine527-N7)-methyltransferase
MEKLKTAAVKLGLHLSTEQMKQFELYYRELIDWNKRISLTSITGYEDVQIKHFLDSLTISRAVDLKKKGLRVVDVGTGAGLPGMPLKIVFPHIRLTLIEATIKKTKFLEQVISKLDLKEVEVIASRAETAAHNDNYREKFDVVISRALSSLPALAELMLPFCNTGGCCIAPKKGDIDKEVEQSKKAITLMGGTLKGLNKVDLNEFSDDRILVIISKVKSTPVEYPRRPGMPGKRPIIS